MSLQQSKTDYCEHKEYCGLASVLCIKAPKCPCQMRKTSIKEMPLTQLVKAAHLRQKSNPWYR